MLMTWLSKLIPYISVVNEQDPRLLKIPNAHIVSWLIDPLDGTKNFTPRNGEFRCNLAFIEAQRTVYGFVSVPPVLGQLYEEGNKLRAS